MSTSPSPETQDPKFDELQRVLAGKRREESPPPGYFQNFSRRVRERVQLPVPPESQTWLQRHGIEMEPRVLWYCAFGLLVCAGLIVGLMASRNVEAPPPPPVAPTDRPAGTPPVVQGGPASVSTAPAVETGSRPPFNGATPQTQPAALHPGGVERK
jgi:hypothetical protein